MKIESIQVEMLDCQTEFGMTMKCKGSPWRHAVRSGRVGMPENPEDLKKELCRMVDALYDWHQYKNGETR